VQEADTAKSGDASLVHLKGVESEWRSESADLALCGGRRFPRKLP
jgi:hypothetical protein